MTTLARYVPALVVRTVQVNVEITPAEIGPVKGAHPVAPPVPEIVQVANPAGATALADPVTVAVKITVPPRVGVPVGATTIVGVAGETTVEVEVTTEATAK
jgi:hypothetical protein